MYELLSQTVTIIPLIFFVLFVAAFNVALIAWATEILSTPTYAVLFVYEGMDRAFAKLFKISKPPFIFHLPQEHTSKRIISNLLATNITCCCGLFSYQVVAICYEQLSKSSIKYVELVNAIELLRLPTILEILLVISSLTLYLMNRFQFFPRNDTPFWEKTASINFLKNVQKVIQPPTTH